MRTTHSSRCPLCRAEIDRKQIVINEPFRCPRCDRYLCVPASYSRLQIWASLFISGLLGFVLGVRGAYLALVTTLIFLPVMFIVVFWTMHFAPPKLKICDPFPPVGYVGSGELETGKPFPMQIRVLFFGVLKDLAGKPSDSLSLPETATLGDVLSHYERAIPRLKETRHLAGDVGESGICRTHHQAKTGR